MVMEHLTCCSLVKPLAFQSATDWEISCLQCLLFARLMKWRYCGLSLCPKRSARLSKKNRYGTYACMKWTSTLAQHETMPACAFARVYSSWYAFSAYASDGEIFWSLQSIALDHTTASSQQYVLMVMCCVPSSWGLVYLSMAFRLNFRFISW